MTVGQEELLLAIWSCVTCFSLEVLQIHEADGVRHITLFRHSNTERLFMSGETVQMWDVLGIERIVLDPS